MFHVERERPLKGPLPFLSVDLPVLSGTGGVAGSAATIGTATGPGHAEVPGVTAVTGRDQSGRGATDRSCVPSSGRFT